MQSLMLEERKSRHPTQPGAIEPKAFDFLAHQSQDN